MSSYVWQLVKQRQQECTVVGSDNPGESRQFYLHTADKGWGRKWKWKQRRFLIIFLFGCDNGNANFIWCNHALSLSLSLWRPQHTQCLQAVLSHLSFVQSVNICMQHTHIRRERQRLFLPFLILLTLSEYNLLLSDWISSSSSLLLLLFFVLNIYFNLISHFTICQRALSLGYTWLKKKEREYTPKAAFLFLSFSTFYCPNCDIIFQPRAGQFELALINEPVVMPGSNAFPPPTESYYSIQLNP